MSHYDYLEEHLPDFFQKMGINWENNVGIIVAHGDKGYGYKDRWEKAGIPFHKGMAIFLLSYCNPYYKESRETPKGWIDVCDWVINNKDRFLDYLPDDYQVDK